MPERNDSKSARAKRDTRKRSTAVAEESRGGAVEEPVGAAEARDLVRETTALAREGARQMGASSLGPLGAVTASEADVADELLKGNPAFGSFVKQVGLAVAEAQEKLDQNMVKTAEMLSKTQIDVIAVFEQQISDNDGSLEKGNPIIQKLPLVNYLMPTAYHWSRVYLEADMKVSEFNAANGFKIQGKSQSFNVGARANYGPFGFGASGGFNYGQSSSEVQAEASSSVDQAAGSLHMEATLEPRADIELPRPFVLQKGPKLKLNVDERKDITTTSGTPAVTTVTGTSVKLTAYLKDTKNAALAGKEIAVSVDQPTLGFSVTPSDRKTNSDGKVTITLERKGLTYDPTTPLPTVVRVWFGLVSDEVAVTL